MNYPTRQLANSIAKQPENPAAPRRAWLLWNQLTDLADQLWNHYENHFLQFCIEHNNAHPPRHVEPMPFD